MENSFDIRIKAFGQLAERIGQREWILQGISDSEALLERLYRDYPALRGMQFSIAINRKTVQGKTALEAGCEVALLPPFSGG